MNDNYTKAYKEVIEILKFVPKESVDKIPTTMIEMFQTKMDKKHNFKIDEDKNFEEQEILSETKAILANIFRDYWATPIQREKIIAKQKYDRQKLEEHKKEKYNSNDIFKKKEKVNNNEKSMIEYKKENLFKRILNKIKEIFK